MQDDAPAKPVLGAHDNDDQAPGWSNQQQGRGRVRGNGSAGGEGGRAGETESPGLAAGLTSNRPLLDEDSEDSQDADGLNGGSPEVVDVGHTVEDLDNVTGNEVDAVSRLLLGDAWLQEGQAGGGWGSEVLLED